MPKVQPVGELGELPDQVERVLAVADEIPPGQALAYGDIAELVGRGGPRQVGQVMSRYGSLTCWWRVVRADGSLPDALTDRARPHWLEEGTPLVGGTVSGRRVDLLVARWDGSAVAEPPRSAGEGLSEVHGLIDPW